MKLIAYVLEGRELKIRPAPVERVWIDTMHDRFAYRCLPLAVANAHGWEILCDRGFVARWKGSRDLDSLTVFGDPGEPHMSVGSHFGHGILTFHLPCLFSTDPGIDLLVQGPVNRPKDAIVPLSGIIETDWAPYTFTMNWQFTRPGVAVRFDKGEPFCHLWPLQRGALQTVNPEIRSLSEAPELKQQHEVWSAARSAFNNDLKQPGSEARAQKWQKLYHRGLLPDGNETTSDHCTRLRLKPFRIVET
jgi:hypothetical protein